MTSLAGAVQAVDSGELLESLGMNGGQGLAIERGAGNGLHLQPSGAFTESVVRRRGYGRSEPAFTGSILLPDAGAVYLFAKRLTDIVAGFFGLVLLSPLIGIFALLIKLSDGGPVF